MSGPDSSKDQLPKVEIMPGYDDLSACTFIIHREDHTIGNSLRYMIMQNPQVEFCGYSAPHPSEWKIHLRIQMYSESTQTAPQALQKALDDLEALFVSIQEKYDASFAEGDFERVETPKIDWNQVKVQAAANKERKRQAETSSMQVD